jgi:PTH1 family peptidyl-tRNA hydrolase
VILIVGLGNPGKRYEKTRHNIGRLVVGYLREIVGFPNFTFQKKTNALIAKGIFNKEKLILALPETFMNLSGQAVKSLVKNYKIKTQNIWVCHDDIDLPLVKIRIIKNRGAAGHKGVESIIRTLNSKDFIRFRIGIRPPEIKKIRDVENFVLQKFSKREQGIVEKVIKRTAEAIETTLKEGLEKVMSEFNK